MLFGAASVEPNFVPPFSFAPRAEVFVQILSRVQTENFVLIYADWPSPETSSDFAKILRDFLRRKIVYENKFSSVISFVVTK